MFKSAYIRCYVSTLFNLPSSAFIFPRLRQLKNSSKTNHQPDVFNRLRILRRFITECLFILIKFSIREVAKMIIINSRLVTNKIFFDLEQVILTFNMPEDVKF